jgi:hypothetical protein
MTFFEVLTDLIYLVSFSNICQMNNKHYDLIINSIIDILLNLT